MRPLIAGAGAFIVAAMTVANASLAATNWRNGDALVYDVTIELQQHHVRRAAPRSSPSPSRETTTESASSGSMTLNVRSADGRGGARASADLVFMGRSGARMTSLVRTVPATIDANGRIALVGFDDAALGRVLDLANDAIADAVAHGSKPGHAWQTTERLSGTAGSVPFARLIQTARPYQGYPTIGVLSSGSTSFQNDGQTARLSIASTTYYDMQDRLLIGAAVRSFTLVVNNKGGHVESTTTVNVALRELDRSPTSVKPSRSRVASPTPAPAPLPTRLPASAVTPIPGATGAPTSTPMTPALPSAGT